jgi:4-azaleucine resistance transporter AzlC
MGLSIGVSVVPFGLAFGVLCEQAGLSWLQALGFSALVFTGGSQFAALSVLDSGGRWFTAATAGLLLAIRSLAYGVVMAPSFRGSRLRRAALSQLMIDESMAVGTSARYPENREYGYLAGGLSVFVLWNAATLVGAVLLSSAGDLVTTFGFDATIPAAFLALVWPRLRDDAQRSTALVGAVIAFATISFVPAGLPIILAGLAIVIVRDRRPAATDASDASGSVITLDPVP